MNFSKRQLSYAAAALTVLIWSSSFTGISIALESFEPGHLVLLRFLIASLFLLAWSAFHTLPTISKKDWPLVIVLALLGLAGYHLLLIFGQDNLPAATTSLIVASIPIWVAFISFLFKSEKLGIKSWLAIFVSFTGVGMTVLSKASQLHFTYGATLVLLAAIFSASRYVFQVPLLARYGSHSLNMISIWIATIPMLYFSPKLIDSVQEASLASILAAIYIGTLPIYAYSIWSFAILHLSATFVASFLNIIPILATLIAWFVLGELPSPIALLGGCIAILGIFLLYFSRMNFPSKEKTSDSRTY